MDGENRMQRFVASFTQSSKDHAAAPPTPTSVSASTLNSIESKPHIVPSVLMVLTFVTLCVIAPPFVVDKTQNSVSILTVAAIALLCGACCYFAPQIAKLELWNQLKLTE